MSFLHVLDDFYKMRPQHLTDQHFALTLTPEDLESVTATPTFAREYYRPWRPIVSSTNDQGSYIKWDSQTFQIHLDVQHFKPNEITVKAGEDYVIVKGKHDNKQDGQGLITREFTRRYPLPKGVISKTVESKLSPDGILIITAIKKDPEAAKNERVVPIITAEQNPKPVSAREISQKRDEDACMKNNKHPGAAVKEGVKEIAKEEPKKTTKEEPKKTKKQQ